jgi:hypothetical protein
MIPDDHFHPLGQNLAGVNPIAKQGSRRHRFPLERRLTADQLSRNRPAKLDSPRETCGTVSFPWCRIQRECSRVCRHTFLLDARNFCNVIETPKLGLIQIHVIPMGGTPRPLASSPRSLRPHALALAKSLCNAADGSLLVPIRVDEKLVEFQIHLKNRSSAPDRAFLHPKWRSVSSPPQAGRRWSARLTSLFTSL